MAEIEAAPGVSTASSGLFARNATGLVRSVTPFSAYIINFIPGTPVQALGYGLFFAFALFPGGNFFIGGLLTIPLTVAIAYAFGLLTSMMPRSGGDYIFVGRVIHPSLSLISSFCMTMGNLLSVAFFGILVVTLGLGPGFIGIGLIAHDPTVVSWGTTISASTGWKFGIGSALFVLGALIHAGGWKWTARVQATLLAIVLLGLLVAGVVALTTSHSAFIANFNHFAKPYTHKADTYAGVITTAQKGGVNVHPVFSFINTIPMIGVFASFGIYSYFSCFVGGELRQARALKTGHTMAFAGVSGILIVLLFAAIFIHTFGNSFMTAANAGGMPAQIGAAPTYFFLLAASSGSTVLAIFLLFAYMVFWPLITYIAFLQPVRMIFAYSLDGILPKSAMKLSRSRTPYVALIATVLVTEGVFFWALKTPSSVTVIVYGVLIELIAMALVAVAAIVVPWRRPELYRAGSTTRRIFGVPIVTVAGVGALAACVFVWVLYYHWSAGFGLTKKGGLYAWTGATIGGAIIYYAVVREVRRRRGVDLGRVYAEIPPE
jgi:amino acid transporter